MSEQETIEALRVKSEALERSNADLQQFASVISHDLAEPLRTVAGFARLLSDRHADRLDGEALEFLRHIAEGTARMQEMIFDLLEVARTEGTALNAEPVDLGVVVERVLEGLEASLRDGGAEVRVGEMPVVQGDRAQLEQLVQNLVANAVKFTAEERPQVHVSAEREQDLWTISVSDDGIGIAPEDRERIFAPYQRVHEAGEYAGSGIGLSICRRVVERHGGRIWAEPGEGGGTRVRFTLPAGAAGAAGSLSRSA